MARSTTSVTSTSASSNSTYKTVGGNNNNNNNNKRRGSTSSSSYQNTKFALLEDELAREEKSFIQRKIEDGILVQSFIALTVLCLFAGACALGWLFWDKFMIKPWVGSLDTQRVNSTFVIGMGQSVAQPLNNIQAFVEAYELKVTPESMASQLSTIEGLQVRLYENNKNSKIQIGKVPSVTVQEHWNMGTLNVDGPITDHTGKYKERRMISLNRGSNIFLKYHYKFSNVVASSLSIKVLGMGDQQVEPECETIPGGDFTNCTLTITNLLGDVTSDSDIPPTYNFTLEFDYQFELVRGESKVHFVGEAALKMENTVFGPSGKTNSFDCDLKTLTCKVLLVSGTRVFWGATRMTLVASQTNTAGGDIFVTKSQNPEIQFSVKPVERKWLHLTFAIVPIGIIFLLFCCIECCLFCCINCRPYKKKGYSHRYVTPLDDEKQRLLDERNSNLYRH